MVTSINPADQQKVRPGRFLLGWSSDDEIAAQLPQLNPLLSFGADTAKRCRDAREKVAERPIADAPADSTRVVAQQLSEFLQEFGHHPFVAARFIEGWTVKEVSLKHVLAIQCYLFTDYLESRVKGLNPNDPIQVARIALSLDVAGYDVSENNGAWEISSVSHNLRVIAPVRDVQNGILGFQCLVPPSVICVEVTNKGRCLLTDGHHRAAGLLNSGVEWVPALVRDGPPGRRLDITGAMLNPGTVLNGRGPTLADYFDDEVSMSVDIVSEHKVIRIEPKVDWVKE